MREPHPMRDWPDVATRAVVTRQDRFFPVDWQRDLVRARLGSEAEELDG